MNNSSGIAPQGLMNVTNRITFTSGKIEIGSNDITLGATGTVSGASSTSYVVADNGKFIKYWSATGLFDYPIGDADEYSPISINFNSGVFGGSASLAFQVIDAVESNVNTIGTSYITRHWVPTSSNILNPNYDMDASYQDVDIVGTESSIIGTLHNGTFWTDGKIAESDGLNLLSADGLTEFGNIAGRNNPVLLPVELLYFKKEVNKENICFKWATASEVNNSHFVLEYSVDGGLFNEVGLIEGKGNSDELNEYEYCLPCDKKGYYRLSQIDFDGNFENFNVLFHECDNNTHVKAYLNRKTNSFIVEGNEPGDILMIRDVNGKLVRHLNISSVDKIEISEISLSKGAYFISIQRGADAFSFKVVK